MVQVGAASLVMVLLATAIELIAPRTRPTWRERARALSFVLIFGTLISIPLHHVWLALWNALGAKPTIDLYLDRAFGWAGWGAPALEVIVALLISDLFLYWYHRLEHVALWRFHALHHSVEELHALSNYGHPVEDLIRLFLMAGPFSLLGLPPLPGALALFVGWKESFIHSPTSASLGPLRYLMVDNVYHRIHHSRHPEHFDRNFGIITPLWDIVFGTAYFPAKDEWPDTGVAGVPEPKSLMDFALFPIARFWRRAPLQAAE
jgi:sterol desaturase/sphingolipid hydroxylase (fatty acid hydroxylase superfamily)